MRGFSKAIIMGNLTRDPEMRTTPSGAKVCGFSVAVNRVYKDASGANQENVSFIDCSAWGRLGEVIAQYARKGSGVLVSGRLDQRSWEDKETGGKRSKVEIVAEDFNFTGGGERSDGGGGSYGGGAAAAGAATAVAAGSATKSAPPADVVPEDINGDEPIDLSEIPF